jgi:hypothetical protein
MPLPGSEPALGTSKFDIFHPEVFIKYTGYVSVKTQQCGIRNITVLHKKGYMFRLS